ncbi:MAG: ADP-glyceromanno-heptose 6-epimerase [Ferruginibacter sp.]|nr:ADP-glyceromanno-heptose 6-epimerase [Ferruginibacter sp.]
MFMESVIIVTGAAGFIGSCLTGFLNDKGFENLILVDDFSREDKILNLSTKKFIARIEREEFFNWLNEEKPSVDFFFHLGARTDTTEFDYSVHQKLNVEYSQLVWKYCTTHQVRLVYASSAATYGNGSMGYDDNHELPFQLSPLNPYGKSKNEFDKWALKENSSPPFWAGLKFFNVYGPNEYHKGRMASVIFHSFNQIRENGFVKLFRSHKEGFKDGEQLRDFVYVKDVINVCFWMMEQEQKIPSGLYNLGTGKARTFLDLALASFSGLDIKPDIRFIDMPEDIRESYQYYTQANMKKLISSGYQIPMYSLEAGIGDYVRNYLAPARYY